MRRAAKVNVPLDKVLQAYGLPAPRLEYRFHSERRWRFDAAWPTLAGGVALEVNGGAWTQGRHTRGAGYVADAEKRAEAQLAGWIVIDATPGELTSEKTISQLKRALAAKGVTG